VIPIAQNTDERFAVKLSIALYEIKWLSSLLISPFEHKHHHFLSYASPNALYILSTYGRCIHISYMLDCHSIGGEYSFMLIYLQTNYPIDNATCWN
jgi:hypothetical protein